MRVRKIQSILVPLTAALFLAGSVTGTELKNIEKITPQGSEEIDITGKMDLNGKSLTDSSGTLSLEGGNVEVPNGNLAVSGNTDGVDLDNPGTAITVNSNQYEVSDNSISVTELDTGSTDTRYLNRGGDAMNGNLNMGGNRLENVGTPNSEDDAFSAEYWARRNNKPVTMSHDGYISWDGSQLSWSDRLIVIPTGNAGTHFSVDASNSPVNIGDWNVMYIRPSNSDYTSGTGVNLAPQTADFQNYDPKPNDVILAWKNGDTNKLYLSSGETLATGERIDANSIDRNRNFNLGGNNINNIGGLQNCGNNQFVNGNGNCETDDDRPGGNDFGNADDLDSSGNLQTDTVADNEISDNTVDNSEIQNNDQFTFGGITNNGNLDMNNNRVRDVSELDVSTSSEQIASFSSTGIDFKQPLSVESSGPLSVANGIELTGTSSNTLESYSTLYLETSSGSPSDIVLDPTGQVGVDSDLSVGGNASISGDIDMENGQISNLQDPDDPQDAATRSYVNNNDEFEANTDNQNINSFTASGDTISLNIENGGSASATINDDTIADNQDLSSTADVSGTDDRIEINGGSNTVIDDDFEADTDTQDLSINGDTISLDRGGSVTITDNVQDGDTDNTNELQDLEDVRSRDNTLNGNINLNGNRIVGANDVETSNIGSGPGGEIDFNDNIELNGNPIDDNDGTVNFQAGAALAGDLSMGDNNVAYSDTYITEESDDDLLIQGRDPQQELRLTNDGSMTYREYYDADNVFEVDSGNGQNTVRIGEQETTDIDMNSNSVNNADDVETNDILDDDSDTLRVQDNLDVNGNIIIPNSDRIKTSGQSEIYFDDSGGNIETGNDAGDEWRVFDNHNDQTLMQWQEGSAVTSPMGVAAQGISVGSIIEKETWSGGSNTVSGHDLGSWSFSGGSYENPGSRDYVVDLSTLPDGLDYQVWDSGGTLESPTIDLRNYQPHPKEDYVSDPVAKADSKVFLTVWAIAHSMDSDNERLEIEVTNDNMGSWDELSRIIEDNDDSPDTASDTNWRQVTLDITQYADSGFKIRFVGTGGGGGDSYGVSNMYIHQAKVPSKISFETIDVNGGKIDMNGNNIDNIGGDTHFENNGDLDLRDEDIKDANNVRTNKIYDEEDGQLDVADDLDLENHDLRRLNQIHGNSGNDVTFIDRPKSEDGLFIDSGTAYFDDEIRTDVIQDRSGGNTIRSDSNIDMNGNSLRNVNSIEDSSGNTMVNYDQSNRDVEINDNTGFQLPVGKDAY